jgi:hypothetical protein
VLDHPRSNAKIVRRRKLHLSRHRYLIRFAFRDHRTAKEGGSSSRFNGKIKFDRSLRQAKLGPIK